MPRDEVFRIISPNVYLVYFHTFVVDPIQKPQSSSSAGQHTLLSQQKLPAIFGPPKIAISDIAIAPGVVQDQSTSQSPPLLLLVPPPQVLKTKPKEKRSRAAIETEGEVAAQEIGNAEQLDVIRDKAVKRTKPNAAQSIISQSFTQQQSTVVQNAGQSALSTTANIESSDSVLQDQQPSPAVQLPRLLLVPPPVHASRRKPTRQRSIVQTSGNNAIEVRVVSQEAENALVDGVEGNSHNYTSLSQHQSVIIKTTPHTISNSAANVPSIKQD